MRNPVSKTKPTTPKARCTVTHTSEGICCNYQVSKWSKSYLQRDTLWATVSFTEWATTVLRSTRSFFPERYITCNSRPSAIYNLTTCAIMSMADTHTCDPLPLVMTVFPAIRVLEAPTADSYNLLQPSIAIPAPQRHRERKHLSLLITASAL